MTDSKESNKSSDINAVVRRVRNKALTADDVCNIIKACYKSSVVSLQYRDLSLEFAAHHTEESPQQAVLIAQGSESEDAPGETIPDDDNEEQLDQLKVNPFDIIRLEGAHVSVMPHLDRLKSIFNASFPMYEILPVILEEGLVDLYDSQGWLEEDELPPAGVAAPTISQLHARIGELVRAKGYEQRITDNITAALKTRNLFRIGIALHTYADSWAHQNFSGLLEDWNSVEKRSPVPAIGHAQAFRKPDDPGLMWSDPRLVPANAHIVNRDRVLAAARMIYKYLNL